MHARWKEQVKWEKWMEEKKINKKNKTVCESDFFLQLSPAF